MTIPRRSPGTRRLTTLSDGVFTSHHPVGASSSRRLGVTPSGSSCNQSSWGPLSLARRGPKTSNRSFASREQIIIQRNPYDTQDKRKCNKCRQRSAPRSPALSHPTGQVDGDDVQSPGPTTKLPRNLPSMKPRDNLGVRGNTTRYRTTITHSLFATLEQRQSTPQCPLRVSSGACSQGSSTLRCR